MEKQIFLTGFTGVGITKECPGCRTELPLSAYYKNKAMKDGVQTYCKACLKDSSRRIPHEKVCNETEKKCAKCGEWKPHKEFPKNHTQAFGVGNRCKDCKNKTSKRFFDPDATEKKCNKCGLSKPLKDFHRRGKDRYQPMCKACKTLSHHQKRYDLKRSYSMSIEDYNGMLEKQDYKCAICGETCLTGQNHFVDHEHTNGINRGLLCRSCNLMLGYAHDDIEMLKSAIKYLKEYK